MARTLRLDVHDWDLHTAGPLLVFIPSGRTRGRQYLVTLVAAVLAGLILWQWGVPPGSYKVSRQQRVVDRHERAVAQAEQQLEALGSGGSVGELHRSRVAGAESQLRVREDALERERQRLAQTHATLGPLGNTLYAVSLALLALVGLGYPQLARFERLVIRCDGGVLRVRHRLQPWAARRLDAERFAGFAAHARRLVAYEHQSRSTSDHGWAWSVVLVPAADDAGGTAVELVCDHEHVLSSRANAEPRRVRDTLAFFQRQTGLAPGPTAVTDVADVGSHGRRTFRTTRRG